jgi:hypothetical protein
MTNDIIENTGRLCSIYCPSRGKVTDKISFNLLREAGGVTVVCPICFAETSLTYDGKRVTVNHQHEAMDEFFPPHGGKRKRRRAKKQGE